MAAELVRYDSGKPAILNSLLLDGAAIKCDLCNAEYRLHYSQDEASIGRLVGLRVDSLVIVSRSHALSHPSMLLIE